MTESWQEGFGLGPRRTDQSSELRAVEEIRVYHSGELGAGREAGGEVLLWVGERKNRHCQLFASVLH